MNSRCTLLTGDSLTELRKLPANSVHCVVTSPPYWGLRDYNVEGQLGSEPTPTEYIANLTAVFSEVYRVLRPDGTLWLNIGDTYCTKPIGRGSRCDPLAPRSRKHSPAVKCVRTNQPSSLGLKHKDLVGIPWMLAFALRDAGWYLRSENIWHKTNPIPESVNDRPGRTHEQLFLLSKSPKYYYDSLAVHEPVTGNSHSRGNGVNPKSHVASYQARKQQPHANPRFSAAVSERVLTRGLRTVWRIGLKGFKGAHFATFPPALVEPCILAGTSGQGCCSECGTPLKRLYEKVRIPTRPGNKTKLNGSSEQQHGNRDPQRHITTYRTTGWERICGCTGTENVPCTVLDPFSGAGTTCMVALQLGRQCIGIELNPDYVAMTERRLAEVQGNLLGTW